MHSRLKTVEQCHAGEPCVISFADSELLLDPAGVAMFAAERVLVVADLHLEKGSSFARRGVYLPPYDTAATLARLGALVAKHDPEMIISLGDSFHDFEASGRLLPDALSAIEAIARGRQMVWVTGNHDPAPPEGIPGDCADEVALGSVVLRHVPEPKTSGHEISGHLHPAAAIRVRGKRVRRPCFACDGTRLIMPSFGVFTGGLELTDKAFAGLFSHDRLVAHMMGSDRVYPVQSAQLEGFGQARRSVRG